MSDSLYMILYLVTEVLNYILAYIVFFNSTITKKKTSWLIGILLVLIFHFAMLNIFDVSTSSLLSFISMLVVPVLLLRPFDKRNIIIYPFIIISTSVIAISMTFLFSIIFNIKESNFIEKNILGIVCQIFPSFIAVIVMLMQKYKKIEKIEVSLGWKQYVLFYVVGFSTLCMIGSIQVVVDVVGYNKIYSIVGISVSLACITLIFITLWQGVIVNRQIQLEERNKIYQKYMQLQKSYYMQILNRDEKIRRFKHDVRAHFTVISAYCENGDISGIKKYINDVMNNSAVYDVKSYTGNSEIDAIITYQISEAPDNIKVYVNGNVPVQTRISEYDLCTIIYNLLSNAIEASKNIKDNNDKEIFFDIGVFNKQLYIRIKNKYSNEYIKENNILLSDIIKKIKNGESITLKEDKLNHGMGLKNVRNAVENYNGNIEIYLKDYWFVVEINI